MSRRTKSDPPEWQAVDRPGACVDCGLLAYLKNAAGQYRHKVCADQAKAAR